MNRLKLVFHVEDADTKEILVETSQMIIGEKGPTPAFATENLARDHKAEIVALVAAGKRDEAGAAHKDDKAIEDLLSASGDLVWRFIRIRLREWAQRERAKEPA